MIRKIKDFLVDLSEANRALIHLLVFIVGLILLILSMRSIGFTIISFETFQIIILVILTFSVILTFVNFKIFAFVKRLWLFKIAEIYLYFSIMFFSFFSINNFITFKTDLIYDSYETCEFKETKTIFGLKQYKINVCEQTYDLWGSGGWVYVDSSTFHKTGDYISIKIDRGILGLKVISKNQR
ncbi:MAG: hypothetical protein AB7S48_17285 [Bacteroidales bacterium]